MIEAIKINLQRGISLLNLITDEQYSNCSVKPYNSSIGKNIRHVLDIFNCIFEGLDTGEVNLSKRKRNTLVEEKTASGINYFNEIIARVTLLESANFDTIINVTDNLGTGQITINYTLGGLLVQAHSHTIHHYANIGFIMSQLNIELTDTYFGYNPTTVKK